ncbi:MAG: SAM-dependent methyltransferase [Pseudobdellovibrio sp.]|jgi:cyclopropane-fatty-acyl-phospholipid synthase|nr:SAM-dependent methyltransferase [Pseudobdellovibrio sp.]
MRGPSIATRVFLKILEGAQHGQVKITFPDGKTSSYGYGGAVAEVTVADWEVFDLLFRKGDIGLAEAIITNRMQVSDVANLVEWACKNDQALGEAFRGKWYGVLADRIKHLLARNSRQGAKNNIVAHYDLGNEFYKLWLDQSMTYSSAIFQENDSDLHCAQMKKYDRIIEQLEIKSSDHILEIGCGWGGFFSRAVEKTGCKVTAVMNSPSQAKHNREMIEKKGFTQNVELRQIDYRDIEGKFDKVVSIEMVEAVGEQYWNDYFKKITSSLKTHGKAMIQGITIREDLFYSYRKSTDFIQQYVFPGGMLLTDSVFENQSEKNSLQLEDKFKFPGSYARTLQIWRENFNMVLPDVKQLGYDEKFIRLWDLYLAYCEGAFRAGRISVGQYQIVNS